MNNMTWYIIGALVGIILGNLITGWFFMLLWNWLAVSLFNLPMISYLQGLGIAIVVFMISSFFK